MLSSLVLTVAACLSAEPSARQAAAAEYVRHESRFLQQLVDDEPPAGTTSRSIFQYALALAEAGQTPDRAAKLLAVARRMQDRDPRSGGYGNFWWFWRDGKVTDANAVEFSMQSAIVLWRRHRESLPEDARKALAELMSLAIEGCVRHRVPSDYTNIAILNAGNLIGLGEAFDRPDVAAEGYRRLEAICLWTRQFGTREFVSPTYYATDLGGLSLIEEFAGVDRGRQQARALRALLWSDIAANWFAPAARLAGPHSRSYDYVFGRGPIEASLVRNGWLRVESPDPPAAFQAALFDFNPPANLRDEINRRYPRVVRQSWGLAFTESRQVAIYRDIAMGSCGALYAAGRQDVPLTVDLPGTADAARCYFVPDGREDPYGKWRLATGAARHGKAWHLSPFWAAAQDEQDAVGLVVYRPEDLQSPEVFNVQSHFVVRRPADGMWLGGRRLDLPEGIPDEATRAAVAIGQPLVLRYGTAALGVRVLWARRQDGETARAALIDDGNSHGALRLTIEHRGQRKTALPGAALWIRVGTALDGAEAFADWRQKFEQQDATCAADARAISCQVPGARGPVSILAQSPFGLEGRVALRPAPYRGVLEVNGREIGRPLLDAVEPMRGLASSAADRAQPVTVPAAGRQFAANDGLVLHGMSAVADAACQSKSYVWQPPDGLPRPPGSVVIPLRITQGGVYYLSVRILAGDRTADSLFVRLSGAEVEVPRTAWNIPLRDDWSWQGVSLDGRPGPTAIALPKGECWLQLQTREAGVKIDSIRLTPKQSP